MDAAILVLLHPETEARALDLATAYRVLDRFEHWLRDPRTRAQAREEAELERRRVPRGSP
jgi:predicted kinase